jgi:dienelactone hydrolase
MAVRNMIGAYGPWAAGLAGRGPAALSFLQPRYRSLPAWRRQARARLRDLLAEPDRPQRPRARVERRGRFGELVFEELSWQLPYGPRTRAVFLKPAGAAGRLPAILALHDHGGNKFFGADKIARLPGAQHPRMQTHQQHYYGGLAWANEIARRGYAVLVPDAFSFASRRVRYADVPAHVGGDQAEPDPRSDEDIAAYNAWAAGHESIMAKSLFCAGTTWPGVFLHEDRCALDYLCTRPDVDPARVGCGGLSGGGLRTVFLGGTDPRIRCAVCVGMMTTWRDYLLNKCHTHTWMIYVPGLPRDLDYPEILGLRAPRPTLVLNDIHDTLFTLPEMKRADRVLRAVYAKAGAPGRYRCSFYPGPHKFDRPMQAEAFDWFDRWLKDKDAP